MIVVSRNIISIISENEIQLIIEVVGLITPIRWSREFVVHTRYIDTDRSAEISNRIVSRKWRFD